MSLTRIPFRRLATLLALSTCLNSPAESLAGKRPNIIFVMTDDQGMGDLSCMGNTVLKTPHLDNFYEKSTRFTDFHVSPTCAPTRSAIMSGRSPFQVGVTHTIFQRERMALDLTTMPQILQSAGYDTGLFGKWHLGDEEEYLPQNRGFDEVLMHGAGGIGQGRLGDFEANSENTYFDSTLLHNDTVVQSKGFCTDLFFHAGLAWIQEQNKTKDPYFAYISLNAPHGPMIAPESYKKRFLDLGYDEKTAGRYGMIENIDDNFGAMMKKLTEWNALENTLVIFMTDNGASGLSGKLNGERVKHHNAGLRGSKNSPYEGGTHVPAFWYWKNILPEGKDIDALTAHLDILPTFAELAAAKLPEGMQKLSGHSLLPLLEGPQPNQANWPKRQLFIHCGRWNTGEREANKFTKCAVRSDRWRWVNNTNLYDIAADPGETKNVASAHPEIVAKMQRAYDQWWTSVAPLMVNEDLPKVTTHPFHTRYQEQLAKGAIPAWAPASIEN